MFLPRCRSPRTRAQDGDQGDLQCRGHRPGPGRDQGLRGRLRRQVPQGGRQDRRRRRRAPGVLQVSGRALDPSAHHEPDRVDLRHRAAADQGHQRPRIPRRGDCHGLQAHRCRTSPLASRQRTTPGRPGPCRRARRHPRRDRRARPYYRMVRPQTDCCGWFDHAVSMRAAVDPDRVVAAGTVRRPADCAYGQSGARTRSPPPGQASLAVPRALVGTSAGDGPPGPPELRRSPARAEVFAQRRAG